MKNFSKSPWSWIPTLYFAEGLPYVAVMTISVIMYKRLGISNTDIALYTGWLYLPWVIKPFWSPFVDLAKTKRWWTVAMQAILAVAFAGIAFTVPASLFFQLTLAFFWLTAFTSATHDIAADGFYMHALTEHQQSLYVGIRSTFYRIATVAGQGLLVILAGYIETSTGLAPAEISVEASPAYSNVLTVPEFASERQTAGVGNLSAKETGADKATGDLCFELTASALKVGITPEGGRTADGKARVAAITDSVCALNEANGFANGVASATKSTAVQIKENNDKGLGATFTAWVHDTFGEEDRQTSDAVGNVAVVGVRLNARPEDGRTVVVNFSFKNGDQSIALDQSRCSTRLEFTPANWDKTAYLLFHVDSKLTSATRASFVGTSGNIPLAWLVVFAVLSAFFLACAAYHSFILPRPATDHAARNVTAANIVREFFATFKSFFAKPQAGVAILFMLLYRLPEAQLVKLINPFLLDPIDKGGLGLTTGQVGFVYGTVGIIGLMLGGIIGGIVAARGGLKRWLWPMAWSMSLTCLTFVYLSYFQNHSLLVVNACVFIEQFGYGFGFTAYMLFLIYFSEGEHKTSHYAICTGFMALGMMIPGMAAGWLQETIGYRHFFVWTMLCCLCTIGVCMFVKIDPKFGMKK